MKKRIRWREDRVNGAAGDDGQRILAGEEEGEGRVV
jgi:hypothetical protein